MNKALIIDDEEAARNNLAELISEHCPDVKIVATASSVKEGLALIGTYHPNVVFLDIEMPEQNGFNLLEHYDDCPFEVIFTTAYDEYAIKAIRFCALDYLLKPIQKVELKNAVARLSNAQHTKERLENLMQLDAKKEITSIVLNSQDDFVKAELSNIIRFEADRSYTYVYFTNRSKLLVSKPMGYFEELLEQQDFIRCHRSHLVNSQHIRRISKGQNWVVTLSNKEAIPVSNRKRGLLNQLRR